MNDDFKDQSNYLVAFLAAVVGLMVFKDDLTHNGLLFFGHRVSYFEICLPLLGSVLLAAYIGALAYLTGSITFTSFPIRKWLSFASSTVAGLGFVYPLIFLLLLLMSWTFHITKLSPGAANSTSVIAGAVTALLGVLVAGFVARDKQVDTAQRQISELINEQQTLYTTKVQKGIPSEYKFLRRYEEVVEFGVQYLKISGYGISGRGLLAVARALSKVNVLAPSDVDVAADINRLRNLYAHGKEKPNDRQITEAMTQLGIIYSKIQNALWSMDVDEKGNGET